MAAEVPTPRPFSEAYPGVEREKVESLLQHHDFHAYHQLRKVHEALMARVRGGEEGLGDIVDPFSRAYPDTRRLIRKSLGSEGYTMKEIKAAEKVARGEVVIE